MLQQLKIHKCTNYPISLVFVLIMSHCMILICISTSHNFTNISATNIKCNPIVRGKPKTSWWNFWRNSFHMWPPQLSIKRTNDVIKQHGENVFQANALKMSLLIFITIRWVVFEKCFLQTDTHTQVGRQLNLPFNLVNHSVKYKTVNVKTRSWINEWQKSQIGGLKKGGGGSSTVLITCCRTNSRVSMTSSKSAPPIPNAACSFSSSSSENVRSSWKMSVSQVNS